MRLIDADKLKEQIKAKTQRFFSDGRWPQECIENEIDAVPTAHHAEKWISVEDRLPKTFAAVIVARGKDLKVEQGYMNVNGWWQVYGTRTKNVRYWMPLPEPPKEELA